MGHLNLEFHIVDCDSLVKKYIVIDTTQVVVSDHFLNACKTFQNIYQLRFIEGNEECTTICILRTTDYSWQETYIPQAPNLYRERSKSWDLYKQHFKLFPVPRPLKFVAPDIPDPDPGKLKETNISFS